ncbi:2-isopropylmalate synthase [Brunnivagina elsteri]|uniref:2-isopropylmalate synthase n=1 Tax=Brunnivagina elsteri CCALA 953 TaxID=987040 RepID=A0A2A2TP66_9CYAN|nr:2-isopropylmalate synthase [Calothrix elsteri]PAX60154.1 2-isopropylmalate synthase [Calothrix elsteri CCALA 953]
MLKNPANKYRPFPAINLPNRTWVNQIISHPPTWLSTDLRDGNQALIEPMNIERKLRMFDLLVNIGFKEIEVGFPSASQTDFDFVRHLIEQQLIPDDVKIQVLTPARQELIHRSFEALRGTKQAIVHLYNATSPVFRRTVLGLNREGTINLAVSAATLFNQLAATQPETNWQFQYSPETFTATELEFAKIICDRILDIWKPTPENKAIINLPATVEVSTPNIFADQVEWMHRNLSRRDSIILCVHPHNDRGCGVAAAELAQMAGAERVEGCLFGNGERTGNVDLVTLALNLYTQGIHPGLDFSNINEIARIVEECTQLPIPKRHPYVGDLVFTAFSGSHQDAIKKGFAVQKYDTFWEVPYLPLDPADVGRSYESIVRVNSQSGKGGIAFLLERDYNLSLPRRLQIEFSQIVQKFMDASGKELASRDIWQLFEQEYLQERESLKYVSHQLYVAEDGTQMLSAKLQISNEYITIHGKGNGPINAFAIALDSILDSVLGFKLDSKLQIHHYEEHSRHFGSNSEAVAYMEIASHFATGFVTKTLHGVGIDSNIVTASLMAITNAVNRAREHEMTGFGSKQIKQSKQIIQSERYQNFTVIQPNL